jgi:endonuclease-3 related protein
LKDSKSFSEPEVYNIYKQLYDYYGTQNWWPGESEFEVIIGAILTQNTAWHNVEKAINNLRVKNLLNINKLAEISSDRLKNLIRPSGFYQLKALRLKSMLHFIVDKYAGDINEMKKQDKRILRKQLLQVNGVGEETADSILLYALGKLTFVVDAYTKRIFSRHNFIKVNASYSEIQEFFTRNLPALMKIYNEYHALLVRLAKDFCCSKPNCAKCPINITG